MSKKIFTKAIQSSGALSSYNFRYQRIVCLVLSSLWLLHSLGIIAYIWCELKDIRNIDARKMFEFWPESVDGFPTDKLKVDQAYLNITSTVDKRLWIYTLSSECVACPFKLLRSKAIPPDGHVVQKISTSYELSWSLFDVYQGPYAYQNTTPLCEISPHSLGEFGIYNLTINNFGCDFTVARSPVNVNSSLLLVCAIGAILTGIMSGVKMIVRKRLGRNAAATASTDHLDDENDDRRKNESENIMARRTSSRLCSLDTFRGLAIVTMIFANSGAGKYDWLEHATWNGIHPADFIFPSFLWIMGVCIPISIKSQTMKNVPRKTILHGILMRSLKLFLIGFFIHTTHGPALGDLRIMGVLQRFSIAYLVTASLYALFGHPIRTDEWQIETRKWRLYMHDIIVLTPQWLMMLAIVAIHLGLIFGLPVPNCPTGYLGPGGIHEGGRFNNCIGGATGLIDRTIIGKSHLYQHPRAGAVYDETMPFDPEGIFGSLLTIVQVFFGIQCGQILLSFTDWKQRMRRWLAWATITLLLGLSLCQFSIDGGLIPINKNLWSLSYVLVTTAFAYYLLSLFYYIIDVRKLWTGKPLSIAGMNAIVLYAGSELFHQMYPFYWRVANMNTHFMFLLANIWMSIMWTLVAYYLYLKKIFISL